jgi:hypothetical protein
VIAGGLVGGMVAYGVRGGASGAYSVGGNTR